MAILKPAFASARALAHTCRRALEIGPVKRKLGYASTLALETPSAFGLTHHATRLFRASYRGPLADLKDARDGLALLQVRTGGFRSMTTFERLNEWGAAFGLRFTRDAAGGDAIWLDGAEIGPLGRGGDLAFGPAGTLLRFTPAPGLAYPTAPERAALDALKAALVPDGWHRYTAAETVADMYRKVHDGHKARRLDARAAERIARTAHLIENDIAFARRELQSLRRSAFATRYGAQESREALDLALASPIGAEALNAFAVAA